MFAVRYGNIFTVVVVVEVGNGERVSPSSADHRSESVGRTSAGSGAEPRPKTILVLSWGASARTALDAILVANFAFFSQGLRLNYHQFGCRPTGLVYQRPA